MLIYLFIPHFFLICSILLLLISNSLIIKSSTTHNRLMYIEVFVQTLSVLFFVFLLIINSRLEGFSTDYSFKIDFGKNLVQIISVVFLLFSFPSIFLSFRSQNLSFFEFFVIILIVVVSLLFIINANSLISIFIAVEIFALCSITLASFNKISAFSTEAGLKYFISSAVFSAVFLLGSSLLYFSYGTVCFDNYISLNKTQTFETFINIRFFIEIGMFLVICWLFFKITGAPFHFWVSDVYDGSPLATTIFFSIVPKFSLIIFFLKWIKIYFSLYYISKGYLIFIICGLLSCFFGFISALVQKKLKKLFIFSSIGQIGYIVIASFVTTLEGYASVIMFSVLYYTTSIVIWNYISVFFALDRKSNIFRKTFKSPFNLTHLSGLYKRNKYISINIAFLIFSLSAIPPMIGFYGKFEIFSAVIGGDIYYIMVLVVILSAISTYYYLELIRNIFFEGNINLIKMKEDFKLTSAEDPFIYIINYISCFLTLFLLMGIFYPEIINNFAIIVALYNDLY